jgi:hypothetical protein
VATAVSLNTMDTTEPVEVEVVYAVRVISRVAVEVTKCGREYM